MQEAKIVRTQMLNNISFGNKTYKYRINKYFKILMRSKIIADAVKSKKKKIIKYYKNVTGNEIN